MKKDTDEPLAKLSRLSPLAELLRPRQGGLPMQGSLQRYQIDDLGAPLPWFDLDTQVEQAM